MSCSVMVPMLWINRAVHAILSEILLTNWIVWEFAVWLVQNTWGGCVLVTNLLLKRGTAMRSCRCWRYFSHDFAWVTDEAYCSVVLGTAAGCLSWEVWWLRAGSMGMAILLFAKSCCRLSWQRWLYSVHLLWSVLLRCCRLQLTSSNTSTMCL